jgi:hypothetical protein
MNSNTRLLSIKITKKKRKRMVSKKQLLALILPRLPPLLPVLHPRAAAAAAAKPSPLPSRSSTSAAVRPPRRPQPSSSSCSRGRRASSSVRRLRRWEQKEKEKEKEDNRKESGEKDGYKSQGGRSLILQNVSDLWRRLVAATRPVYPSMLDVNAR